MLHMYMLYVCVWLFSLSTTYLFVELIMIVSIQSDIQLCVQVCMHVHNDLIQ